LLQAIAIATDLGAWDNARIEGHDGDVRQNVREMAHMHEAEEIGRAVARFAPEAMLQVRSN